MRQLFCYGLSSLLLIIISHILVGTSQELKDDNSSKKEVDVNSSLEYAPNTIPLDLDIFPHQEHGGKRIVVTNTNLTMIAKLESKKYDDLAIYYKWTTKDGTIATGWNVSQISHTFKVPSDENFVQVEAFHENQNHVNDTGLKRLNLDVKAPVTVTNLVGKLFLEHGELLNITLVFNGSTPFQYCYRICLDGSLLPCNFCFPSYETSAFSVPITKYLHYVGNYTLYFDINNVINREVKYYAIKINDTIRAPTLPIVPIASSIMAVLILLTGITFHLHFRKTASTETADFDFIGLGQEEEEWEEELSFIERVKYIFYGASHEDLGENARLISNCSQQRN